MKKILLSFIICLGVAAAAQAQGVAGYQGKRFMLGYAMAPIIHYDYTRGSNGFELGQFLTPEHRIVADYALTRKVMLGLQYSFSDHEYANHDFSTSFKSTSYAVVLRSFGLGHNFVAPLGNYTTLKLFYTKFTDTHTLIDSNFYKPADIKMIEFGFTVGVGRTRVLFGRAVIDAGVELNFFPKLLFHGLSKKSYIDDNYADRYLLTDEFFKMHIGVSGLLF